MPRDRLVHPRRFLVPIDQRDRCSEALELATYLARAVEGTVTLLALVPLAIPPAGVDGAAGLAMTLAEPEEQRELDRLAREALDEMVAEIGEGVAVSTALSWGPAGQAIVDELEAGEHDIVVVSTRREDGPLGHLIHDHAVRRLLSHCPVSVLVVPAAGAHQA